MSRKWRIKVGSVGIKYVSAAKWKCLTAIAHWEITDEANPQCNNRAWMIYHVTNKDRKNHKVGHVLSLLTHSVLWCISMTQSAYVGRGGCDEKEGRNRWRSAEAFASRASSTHLFTFIGILNLVELIELSKTGMRTWTTTPPTRSPKQQRSLSSQITY